MEIGKIISTLQDVPMINACLIVTVTTVAQKTGGIILMLPLITKTRNTVNKEKGKLHSMQQAHPHTYKQCKIE